MSDFARNPLQTAAGFEAFIERFEDEWQAGRRPDLATFVPHDLRCRGELLEELIQIDWEYRLKAGLPASEDEYRSHFPELFATTELLSKLIAVKQRLARQSDAPQSRDSFAQPSLKSGMTLGNYTIVEPLGQGGMGLVFKATHRTMKRTVALKIIAPKTGWTDESLVRFRREVETVARLSHPNIVTAHDADDVDGVRYLVMELVHGTDLSRLVRERGPLTVEQAVEVILQAARGLEHAHAEGIIHRDIKPGNLILSDKGVVKVLDLGLARWQTVPVDSAQDHSLTESGQVVGTVDYMSPEQALNTKNADARSDIYSLGCTLWFLLTGRPVYSGDSVMERLVAHREQPIPDVAVSLRETSQTSSDADSRLTVGKVTAAIARSAHHAERDRYVERLNGLFRRMIAKKPDDRLQTMTEVTAELELLKALISSSSQPTSVVKRSLAEVVGHIVSESGTTSVNDAKASPVTTDTMPSSLAKQEDTIITGSGQRRTRGGRIEWQRIVAGMLVVVCLVAGPWWALTRGTLGVVGKRLPTVASQNSSVDTPDNSADSHRIEPDRSAEQAAAEWVLSVGGRVQLRVNGDFVDFKAGDEFPASSAVVERIHLPGAATVDDEGLARIGRLRGLKVLYFGERSNATAKVWSGLRPAVSSLDAIYFPIGATPAGYALIRDMPNLKDLIVPFDSGFTDAMMADVAGLKQLSILELGSTSVTDVGLKTLGPHPNLVVLGLNFSGISDAGYESLSLFSNLEVLTVNGERGRPAFQQIAKLSKLKQLNIELKQVTPAIIQELQPMKSLENMQIASHGGVEVSEEHVALLTSLPQVTRLRFLLLKLDTDRLRDLAQAKHVTSLDFDKCLLTDEALLELTAANSLRSLTLQSCRELTPAGLAKFRSARPDVQTSTDIADPTTADRTVAEWVLKHGGHVGVRAVAQDENSLDYLDSVKGLPSEVFILGSITLSEQCDLPRDELRQLAELSGLRSLSVNRCESFGDDQLLALRPALRNLKSLVLVDTGVTEVGLAAISDLSGITNLQLYGSRITDAAIEPIANLRNLTELDLGRTQVSDRGLAALPTIPSLSGLKITATRVTGSGLAELAKFPKLTALYLSEIGAEGFEHVAKLSELTFLELSSQQITPSVMDALSQAPNLRTIAVGSTASSRTLSAGQVASLAQIRKLDHLILSEVTLDFAAWRQVEKLAELKALGCYRMPMTDDDLMCLVTLKKLQRFGCAMTNLTAAGLTKFKAAQPEAVVDSDIE
jgi:serine/threonine protein kinase/Leucine-rich repeat (LRR) protein